MDIPPREKLLEVATELFALKGFAAVSIRELAQKANANSAMISYYFGGKEGLYRQVLENQFGALTEMVIQATDVEASPMERFRRLGEAYASFNLGSPYWLRLYYAELSNPTCCYESIVKKYIRQIADKGMGIVREGIAAGEFRKDVQPAFASLAMAGMLHYFFLVKRVGESFGYFEPGREGEYVEQAMAVFVDGLQNHK